MRRNMSSNGLDQLKFDLVIHFSKINFVAKNIGQFWSVIFKQTVQMLVHLLPCTKREMHGASHKLLKQSLSWSFIACECAALGGYG